MLARLLPRLAPSKRPGMVVVLCCLAAYLFTAGGHFGSTDEEDLYLNTALLASRLAGLASTAPAADSGQVPLHRAPQEIGQSLAALPWYAAGQVATRLVPPRWGAYLSRAVMTTFNLATTLLTTWVLAQWVSQWLSPAQVMALAGLYGLATLAWPYSQTFYREPLVGLSLLASFWFASRFRAAPERARLLASSGLLILAIATKLTAVMAVPWWIICWLPPRELLDPRRRAGIALLFVVVAIVTLFSLLPKQLTLTAYIHELTVDLRAGPKVFVDYGLYGLLFSPGKGLVWFAPPVLLALFGFAGYWRRSGREALAIAGLLVCVLVVYSTRRGWHGGASWGPRYLLPVLPLLMLPAGETLRWCTRAVIPGGLRLWLARLGVVGIALAGFLVQLAAVSIFPVNYYAVKAQQGVVTLASLDGGPGYLQELFFQPAQSPIWGQAVLAVERAAHLIRFGRQESTGVLPADAAALLDHMVALETLDYWWLHWALRAPEAVAPSPHIGVVLAPAEPGWLALAKQGGASINRWQINWRDVEPSPGLFDFTQTDQQLEAMQAAGMDLSVILTYPPDWATLPGTRVPSGLDLPVDSERNAWARFVRATVARYPHVRYWEVWNEPDLAPYWGGTAADYARLLRAGYLAVKAANPEAKVVMAGLAYWPDSGFFERVLDDVAADPQSPQHEHFFDISAWHWYGRSDDLYERTLWARAVLAGRGLDKPIWINETNALLSSEADRPGERAAWTVTPTEQAAFVVQAYANALAAGVEKTFVFRLDEAPVSEGVGLVTHAQMPRPAYVALQAVAEFLGGATAIDRRLQDGVTQVLVQRENGHTTWVVWNNTAIAREVAIRVDQPMVRVGYPDRRVHVVVARDGQVTLLLPPATASSAIRPGDYFVGGMPVFVDVPSRSEGALASGWEP